MDSGGNVTAKVVVVPESEQEVLLGMRGAKVKSH